MADAFDTCLAFTLEREGGFSDDPHDPGGATCHGITLATYRDWADNPRLDVSDIRDIAAATVREIYHGRYWLPVSAESLPRGVDLMVFDHGVNAGPGRSARLLQEVLGFSGAAVDGAIGPKTLAAAAAADPATVIARLAASQAAYYRSLDDFDRYGAGWLNRVDARRALAMQMIQAATA